MIPRFLVQRPNVHQLAQMPLPQLVTQ